MIIQFTVGNFRSIYEPVTLSMVATKLVSKNKSIDENNTFDTSYNTKILKSAAIYGANASGKSNIIKALRFMTLFINNSVENKSILRHEYEKFAFLDKSKDEESFFEIIFICKGIKYRYGFELNEDRISSEWLFHTPSNRERLLFHREKDGKFEIAGKFSEGSGLEKKTRPDALFLSVCADFNGKISSIITNWVRNIIIISGLDDSWFYQLSLKFARKVELKEEILKLIKSLDLGIEDIRVTSKNVKSTFGHGNDTLSDSNNDFLGITMHKKYSNTGEVIGLTPLSLENNESDGTRKLFSFATAFISTIKSGNLIIIDELDSKLHPLITQSITKLFNSSANSKCGQLIFSTHDTNLLTDEIFRRDQIWFTEKNNIGATTLFSLSDYKTDGKTIRADASFEKDYITGKYGAIPFIGSLSLMKSFLSDE